MSKVILLVLCLFAGNVHAQVAWNRLPRAFNGTHGKGIYIAPQIRFHDREVGLLKETGANQDASDSLWKTTDGGLTWRELDLPMDRPYTLLDFYMDKGYVWVVCLGRLGSNSIRLLHSNDIGESWEVTPFDSTKYPYEIHFATPNIGYVLASADTNVNALGPKDSLEFTTNGGKTWVTQPSSLVADGLDVKTGYFPNDVLCIRPVPEAASSVTIRSTDFGTTFNDAPNIPEDYCYAGNEVWLAAGSRSTDDGQSWFPDKGYDGYHPWADTTGDAYSLVGSFASPDSVLVSHDRGLTWTEHPFYRGTWPGEVEIVDSLLAYATDGTYIYKTTTGGVGDLAGVSPKVSNSPILQHISNFPNPFSSKTTLSFSNAKRQHVDVGVINILGQECAQLFSGNLDAGDHSFEWNASRVPNGVYFCIVKSESGVVETPLVVRH